MLINLNSREKILLYGANLWYLGEGMLGPLFAIFGQKIGGNILDISWAWAIYLIVTGFFIILVGKISDERFSKNKLMVLGYALNALFTFGYLIVDSPVKLFLIQAGLGIASALATPTWFALYAKYEDRHHEGYDWGLAMGEKQLLLGLAIVIGGLIVNYFSFNILFILMGVIQTLATIYQAKILRTIASK